MLESIAADVNFPKAFCSHFKLHGDVLALTALFNPTAGVPGKCLDPKQDPNAIPCDLIPSHHILVVSRNDI